VPRHRGREDKHRIARFCLEARIANTIRADKKGSLGKSVSRSKETRMPLEGVSLVMMD
jgi:hypothetical protein